MGTICYKIEKILQNWCFCKIFDFTSEAHITKKLTLLKQIVIFFSELTTKILLKPIVIFPKIDNKTFLKKLLNFSQEFITSVM